MKIRCKKLPAYVICNLFSLSEELSVSSDKGLILLSKIVGIAVLFKRFFVPLVNWSSVKCNAHKRRLICNHSAGMANNSLSPAARSHSLHVAALNKNQKSIVTESHNILRQIIEIKTLTSVYY